MSAIALMGAKILFAGPDSYREAQGRTAGKSSKILNQSIKLIGLKKFMILH